jgi:hypothetical protein
VIVPKITPPAIVPLRPTPAVFLATYSKTAPRANDKANQGSPTALPGMVFPVVHNLSAHEVSTSVLSAVPSHTMLNNVPTLHNLFIINTPLIPEQWHIMLTSTNLFNQFYNVPNGLHFSFNMGINSLPTFTYTPPNHNSAISYPLHVLSHIHNKLLQHRYSGPFSCSCLKSLIGPFCTFPLETVPKVGSTSKHRVIQDLSFPRNDPSLLSINNGIDSTLFTCDWGTFNDIRELVINAPSSTKVATLDVDSAFRCCPISPSQQSSFVIHWNNFFYIDHNAPFKAAGLGRVFGRLADAMSAILTIKGFGPSKNWVDDFVFFRYPTTDNLSSPPTFSYSLSDIFQVAFQLGWPWKDSKTKPFASHFKYLGFLWHLPTETVEISDDKKLCYLTKLEPWTSGHKFSRKDTELILGALVYCSLAIPDGQSRLPLISCFASSFNHFLSPFVHLSQVQQFFQTSNGGDPSF